MTMLVRLHIFSGREDPMWALSGDVEQELTAKLAQAEGHPALDTPAERGLGYKGFSILRTDTADGAQPMMFANAKSDEAGGSFLSGHPEIEDFLLSTAGDSLEEGLAAHVRDTLETPPISPEMLQVEATGCPAVYAQNPPAYNPDYWNNDAYRKRNNNCYAYANNQATNTFAQPGRGSGQQYTALTCDNVGAASIRDGLANSANFSTVTPGWYVALVIWPNTDYHWYRQDNVGCWSHKPGQTDVRNVDNAGHPITDPQTADRGGYTTFCTYMVTNTGVTIA